MVMGDWTALAPLLCSTSNLTFPWSHFICHPRAPYSTPLPPTHPPPPPSNFSWSITSQRHVIFMPLSQPHTDYKPTSLTIDLKGLLRSIFFTLFLYQNHPRLFSFRSLFLQVFIRSLTMPASRPSTPGLLVMNDHWPSHWQLGSWCHIITVSPFRQNYQITAVLKSPGKTDRPADTGNTNIWEKRLGKPCRQAETWW